MEGRIGKIVIRGPYLPDEYVGIERRGAEVQISCHRDSPLVVFAEDLAGRLYESGFPGISTNCYAELASLGSRPLNDEPRLYAKFITFCVGLVTPSPIPERHDLEKHLLFSSIIVVNNRSTQYVAGRTG